MVTLKIASLFSNFVGIARFGNQLATNRTGPAPANPLPHSFLSLAVPTLFNACARPANHVLHVTKTRQVTISASTQTQEQRATGPNKLGEPLHNVGLHGRYGRIRGMITYTTCYTVWGAVPKAQR